jgi:hypothetical protein
VPNERGYAEKVTFWLADPSDVESRILITEDEAKRLIDMDPYFHDEGDDEPDDEISEPV